MKKKKKPYWQEEFKDQKWPKRTLEEQRAFRKKISDSKYWKALQERRCELISKELRKRKYNLERDEWEELELLQEAVGILIDAMCPLPR
jgi:hypothetical protein